MRGEWVTYKGSTDKQLLKRWPDISCHNLWNLYLNNHSVFEKKKLSKKLKYEHNYYYLQLNSGHPPFSLIVSACRLNVGRSDESYNNAIVFLFCKHTRNGNLITFIQMQRSSNRMQSIKIEWRDATSWHLIAKNLISNCL